jgi:hypothetical protein
MFRSCAEAYGWGPEQVLSLTPAQLLMYAGQAGDGDAARGGLTPREVFYDAWRRRGACGLCGAVVAIAKGCPCGGRPAAFGEDAIEVKWQEAKRRTHQTLSAAGKPGSLRRAVRRPGAKAR